MKVVIVAKTRMGGGACVGGITFEGRSVRLVASDWQTNEHFNHDYEVGDVWDVEYDVDPAIVPPHVENIIVHGKKRLPPIDDISTFIEHHMSPASGGLELLYDGVTQATKAGAQYISERTGIPPYSTMFWRPDQPLLRCDDAKRIRYRYATPDGVRTLTFVGFQEPLAEIPAGTLLRVSLAHWWRPREMPEGEQRCYVQLSGWYTDGRESFVPTRAPDCDAAPIPASNPDINEAQRVLKQVFGHDAFRPLQEEIIENVLLKKDSLVIMPTGSGKSICFQLPALLFPGLTVVVSPLISLMQDQVEQLRQYGIAAEFLNSTLTYEEHVRITRRMRSGAVKLLYAAPETLLKPETMLLLQDCQVDCLTIDEAHCISQWGHDFRPEYRQLIDLRQRLPQAVFLAATATATERVRQDIKKTLQINDADEFIASFDRKNLFLAVEPKHGSVSQILDYLGDHQREAGIIYCNTKKEVNDLVNRLVAKGWPALPYHADLDNAVRRNNQRRFILEEGLIVVATIAFGMGIDKSNVRFIVHYGLPKNLESYYQQIGRAGRDGLRADCLLLCSRQDLRTIQYFINQQNESQQRGAWERLRAMLAFAETHHCRRPPLLAYFGENTQVDSCDMCDNCLDGQTVEKEDVTVPAKKLLTCVLQTNQIFGAAHIINILRGSKSQKIVKWKHDQLSTYNTGREFSRKQWLELTDQFLALHLLQKDIKYGSLQLTREGESVLRGEKVDGYLPRAEPAEMRRKSRQLQEAYDRELFAWLRAKRSDLAREANVPPYVIFSDYTLSEMATYFPQTESAFAKINGVGEVKLAKYAGDFLPIIVAYCREHDLPEKPHYDEAPPPIRSSSPRIEAIAGAINAEGSVDAVASDFGVKRETILRHLWTYVQNGGDIDSSQILNQSTLDTEK